MLNLILNIAAFLFILASFLVAVNLFWKLKAWAILFLVFAFAYGTFLRALRLAGYETATLFSLFYVLLFIGMALLYHCVKVQLGR